MSEIIDGVIYETQAEHDARIRLENWQYRKSKKTSRNRGKSLVIRAWIMARADGKCEICRFGFTRSLQVHHIYPVRLGGPAKRANLIALCPNCHDVIHRQSRTGRPFVTEARVKHLMERCGLTDAQAKRLLLVASTHARIRADGYIFEFDNFTPPMPCFITDDPENTVEAQAARSAQVEAALQRIEARFRSWEKQDDSNSTADAIC